MDEERRGREGRRERPGTRFHGRVEGVEARCDEPGCAALGEFRAPPRPGGAGGGADGPGRFRLLCLDHVRAFNAGYNFFAGMSVDEIHDAQRPFAGWERETRAFSGADRPPRWADFADPLDAIGARFSRLRPEAERKDGKPLSGEDRKALKLLGLAVDADRAALRRAYSDGVRRFHPDRNGGDRSHEAALRETIAAYQRLRQSPAFA